MTTDFGQWFSTPRIEVELSETTELYQQAKDTHLTLGSKFIYDCVIDIYGGMPSDDVGEALYDAVQRFLSFESINCPKIGTVENLTLAEGVKLRRDLARCIRFAKDKRLLPRWREHVVLMLAGILERVQIKQEDGIYFPGSPLYTLCPNIPELVERVLVTLVDENIDNIGLFGEVKDRVFRNVTSASPELTLPTKFRGTDAELIEAYLRGTPFFEFFHSVLPSSIPKASRLEHMHIIGGTGHGKTQLIQYLIANEEGGFCVIDSQGDMIERLIKRFDCVLLDPTDIEYPLSLNMFDMKTKGEAELNATISLYEYIFGGLLGAELTQRQSLLFGSIARLMLHIPNATIHTLIDVMANGERYKPFMHSLGGTVSRFFEEQFFQKSFAANKQQIMARLYGVLENQTFDRIFSAKENKIDMFEAMNQGKVVLINTAKSFFQSERSGIFGRFFIALIAQAAIRRASIPESKRIPWFVYIDEFHEYVKGGDQYVEDLFNQARKYKVGLICSHQNLGQLEDKLRATIMSSTGIKMAGGVSAKDATALASEMRCDKEEILSTKSYDHSHAEWMCFVRNHGARKVSVPFGVLEELPERPFDKDFNRKIVSQSGTKRTERTQDVRTQPNESDGGIWG